MGEKKDMCKSNINQVHQHDFMVFVAFPELKHTHIEGDECDTMLNHRLQMMS